MATTAPTPAPSLPKPAAATPAAKPNLTPSAGPTTQILKPPPFQLSKPTGLSPWIKLFVYANPGLGKTTLLCTAADVPQMRDVIMVDAEKTELVISDNPRISPEGQEHLLNNRVPINSFKELAPIHDWLKGHCRARDAYLKDKSEATLNVLRAEEARLRGCHKDDITNPMMYRTVLVDSATEVNQMSMTDLFGVEDAKIMAGKADDVEVAGWPEFRMNMDRMKLVMRSFRDLPMNFLCTAHAQYKQDELKKFFYEPALTGQLAKIVQGYFDIVGYMQSGKTGAGPEAKSEYRMYVRPTSNFHAKNRRAVFQGDYFLDPTMQSIMEQTKIIPKKEA